MNSAHNPLIFCDLPPTEAWKAHIEKNDRVLFRDNGRQYAGVVDGYAALKIPCFYFIVIPDNQRNRHLVHPDQIEGVEYKPNPRQLRFEW